MLISPPLEFVILTGLLTVDVDFTSVAVNRTVVLALDNVGTVDFYNDITAAYNNTYVCQLF